MSDTFVPATDPAGSFGNPNDPWSLTSNAYDPATFYCRATDGNGHSTPIHVKVSPALHGQLMELVQSRRIPAYRTYADVVRDSLIHRLRYLSDEYPGAVDLHALEVEERQAQLDLMRTQRDQWKKYLNDLDAQLTELLESGELDEAEWLMDQNEYIESMTPVYLVKLNKIIVKHRQELQRKTQIDFPR